MKKLVLLCALAGLPLGAFAAQEGAGAPMPGGAPQGGPGMGMQGQGMGMGMGHGPHHPSGPPAEFKAACEGKKAGDKVTVNMPRGPVQGTCQLMFRPDALPPGQGQGPQGGPPPQGPSGKGGQAPAPR